MGYNQKNGFTVFELIVAMGIIAVLSVGGAHLMFYLMQNSVFIPNQLNMNMLAADALDIMIEGDDQAKGLRFSKQIIYIRRRRIDFINQDGQEVAYRIRNDTEMLQRRIGGSGNLWVSTPYYQSPGITRLLAVGGWVFRYYDDTDSDIGNDWTRDDDVRRVEITVIARTGSGSYAEWEGQSQQSSSIAVKKFQ